MKYAVIVLSAATLSACDGLSVAQKQSEVRINTRPLQTPQPASDDARLALDKLLAARVKQALEREDRELAANIDVLADAGVVTLWGTAAAASESDRLGKVALQVEGVKAVDNKIVIIKGS